MVYSQVCNWLDDFLDPPLEILDLWDLTEWLEESEIIDVFKEIVIPAYKNKRSRVDAENILYSLLWEYYLFRRNTAISFLNFNHNNVIRIKSMPYSIPMSDEWYLEKHDLLTASEFSGILDNNRVSILRSKIQSQLLGNNKKDKRIKKYEPVIRAIYEKETCSNVYYGIGRVRHPVLLQLAATPDGLIESGPKSGSLLEIKSPLYRHLEEDIIPYEYYCQIQVQMEVLDIESVDYCECRIIVVDTWRESCGPQWIGVIAVLENRTYSYSPLFPNTDEGRILADAWLPESNFLEKQKWVVQDWQVLTAVRNKRWWNMIGLPEYKRFMKDLKEARTDPMFLRPRIINEKDKPLFLDD